MFGPLAGLNVGQKLIWMYSKWTCGGQRAVPSINSRCQKSNTSRGSKQRSPEKFEQRQQQKNTSRSILITKFEQIFPRLMQMTILPQSLYLILFHFTSLLFFFLDHLCSTSFISFFRLTLFNFTSSDDFIYSTCLHFISLCCLCFIFFCISPPC